VLVSTKNLPIGAVLGDSIVKRSVPLDLVDESVLMPNDFDRMAGTKLTRPLSAGFPINASYFAPKSLTFSDSLEPGMRAITIEVDEINSMAQMVKPGNKVDLMLITPDIADTSGGQEVIMVLQNVKVMATGQSVAASDKDARGKPVSAFTSFTQRDPNEKQTYNNFTFEVTPQDAAFIALAQSSGKIRAILRKVGDNDEVKLKDVNSRKLLNMAEKMAERRQLIFNSQMNEMNDADSFKSSMGVRKPEIEYVIGGMGAMATGPLGTPSEEQPAEKKAQNAKPSGSAIKVDKLQNSVSEALRNSGVPSSMAGGASERSTK